jgi:serpin B
MTLAVTVYSQHQSYHPLLDIILSDILGPDHMKNGEVSMSITDEQIDELITGMNTFCFDLFQHIGEQEPNTFFSPYSMSMALAMAYEGIEGESAEQIRSVLHLTLSRAILNQALATVQQMLEQTEGVQLDIANALWIQSDYPFRSSYLETMRTHFSNALQMVNFLEAYERIRIQINTWVEEQTQSKIKNLLPAGSLTPATILVIVNAIYFKGNWDISFDEELTHEAPFYKLDGSTNDVQFMKREEYLLYYENRDYQATSLDYAGGDTSMILILPKEGKFEHVTSSLNEELYSQLIRRMRSQEVHLFMPKFEYTATYNNMVQTLQNMGLTAPFQSSNRDFSRMVDYNRLPIGDSGPSISQIIHKAFVKVDETGTEAAAATAIITVRTASIDSRPQYKIMRLDRPFLFFIRDNETNAILFMGVVKEPIQP